MSNNEEQVLYITSSILIALQTKCKLTQKEVSDIIDKTSLLEFIRNNYEVFHVEGIYANLAAVQIYLKQYGININYTIPS